MQARTRPETYQMSRAPAKLGSAGLPSVMIFSTAVSIATKTVGVNCCETLSLSESFQTLESPRTPGREIPKSASGTSAFRVWNEIALALFRMRCRSNRSTQRLAAVPMRSRNGRGLAHTVRGISRDAGWKPRGGKRTPLRGVGRIARGAGRDRPRAIDLARAGSAASAPGRPSGPRPGSRSPGS